MGIRTVPPQRNNLRDMVSIPSPLPCWRMQDSQRQAPTSCLGHTEVSFVLCLLGLSERAYAGAATS